MTDALDAVEQVLREEGRPMHYKELTKMILGRQLWTTAGKTPAATVNARLAVDVKERGRRSRFKRVAPGVFALASQGSRHSSLQIASKTAAGAGHRRDSPGLEATSSSVVTPESQETPPHKDLPWRDAVAQVLRDAKEAMYYSDIADEIARRRLRGNLGATPAATVASIVATDIKENGDHSTFIRVSRGQYMLRLQSALPVLPDQGPQARTLDDVERLGAITAFGMYWRRDQVEWSSAPRILGQQQAGAKPVDFSGQVGIYLLHDRDRVLYVGRVSDRQLGKRLRDHTTDRLGGRWDRFSWFGILPVMPDGTLGPRGSLALGPVDLITGFEALLIEAIEPPQNRRRGDELKAVEYRQVSDPKIKQREEHALLDRLRRNLEVQ